jgi:hypothetical protein
MLFYLHVILGLSLADAQLNFLPPCPILSDGEITI